MTPNRLRRVARNHTPLVPSKYPNQRISQLSLFLLRATVLLFADLPLRLFGTEGSWQLACAALSRPLLVVRPACYTRFDRAPTLSVTNLLRMM